MPPKVSLVTLTSVTGINGYNYKTEDTVHTDLRLQ